ncbi:hypothetical protein SAMN05192533_10189 [Mesobacillus persicus]|uniref:Uncharacterized protein n=1 Tax=Mesobacillus persicus TaxID=930146 RepID=A0A1H7VSA1_9BACI|nr:hypothetical protein SAMN05192533_10189 [Mesobacillus persicus]
MGIRKRAFKKSKKRNKNAYTFWDGVSDVLFYIPELIMLPIRFLLSFFRSLLRAISEPI